MCTNCHYIYNPYIRRKILVSCGHCDACKQEKALARANRIRNNVTAGTIALFVTLTYNNDCVPYVKRDALMSENLDVDILRNKCYRFVFSRRNGLRLDKKDGIFIVDTRFIPFEERNICDCKALMSLKGLKDNIGILYYPDLQKFYKRLRQILKRDFGYEGKFSYYGCGEYGGYTQRPHFHTLIFVPREHEKIFREAICKAWPYADYSRTSKFIEIARDAASYVASYVNSNSCLLPLLENTFAQKHSASKNFGVVLDCFSLSKILEKVESGDLHYYRKQQFDGETDVSPVLIPSYVINRYFPRCKGFGRLAPSSLFNILCAPERIGEYLGDFLSNVRFENFDVPIRHCSNISDYIYQYTPKETYQIYVRLENCYQKFFDETGLSRYDYAHYYFRTWQLYQSTVLKDSLTSVELYDDFKDYYFNVSEFYGEDGVSDLDFVCPTLSSLDLNLNPNSLRDVVEHTNNMRRIFDLCTKQKKVTNCVLSNFYNV